MALETPGDEAGVAALLNFNKQKPSKMTKVDSCPPNHIEPLPSTQNATYDLLAATTAAAPVKKPQLTGSITTNKVSTDSLYPPAPPPPQPTASSFSLSSSDDENPWSSSINQITTQK